MSGTLLQVGSDVLAACLVLNPATLEFCALVQHTTTKQYKNIGGVGGWGIGAVVDGFGNLGVNCLGVGRGLPQSRALACR